MTLFVLSIVDYGDSKVLGVFDSLEAARLVAPSYESNETLWIFEFALGVKGWRRTWWRKARARVGSEWRLSKEVGA